MVCAVLAKHLVLGCKRMGDTEETFLKLMKESWDGMIEMREVH